VQGCLRHPAHPFVTLLLPCCLGPAQANVFLSQQTLAFEAQDSHPEAVALYDNLQFLIAAFGDD
jgi:hypothetical protein